MLDILFYTAIISGGILVIMLLLSLLSGLDLDIDIGDGGLDSGGMGFVKSILTFLSIGAYVVRTILMTESNPIIAFIAGGLSGIVAILILSYFLRLLLRNQENVNWNMEDARFQKGKVYLKIPEDGYGIVNVLIKGSNRELKAKSTKNTTIETGADIIVDEVMDDTVSVSII